MLPVPAPGTASAATAPSPLVAPVTVASETPTTDEAFHGQAIERGEVPVDEIAQSIRTNFRAKRKVNFRV